MAYPQTDFNKLREFIQRKESFAMQTCVRLSKDRSFRPGHVRVMYPYAFARTNKNTIEVYLAEYTWLYEEYIADIGISLYGKFVKNNSMADNKSKKGWQDDVKIDPKDPNELAYVRKFNNTWTPGAVQVAAEVTGSRSRLKILKWLSENWSRIQKA